MANLCWLNYEIWKFPFLTFAIFFYGGLFRNAHGGGVYPKIFLSTLQIFILQSLRFQEIYVDRYTRQMHVGPTKHMAYEQLGFGDKTLQFCPKVFKNMSLEHDNITLTCKQYGYGIS